ncbi:helix-turn-helix domain-containing protein [Amycolatopsis sp. NPDC098790]|uniref:helix-turn-helix domain-containing protein n=1 Tax=Amycolatopsis sp. NPDC098790 TaxID=3363939 RepID=UPI0038132D50
MNLRNRKREIPDLPTFQSQLAQARLEAGQPSYYEMGKGSILSKPTIHRMLKGDAIPTWRTVEAFLAVCGIPAEEIGTMWKSRWVAVKQTSISQSPTPAPVTRTTPEPTVPTGQTCGECGCWVTDFTLHRDFHQRYELRANRPLVAVPGGQPAA